ncbi:unnamed protein product [Heterosigma akashiwo]
MVLERGQLAEYDSPAVLLRQKGSLFFKLCERSGDLDQLRATAEDAEASALSERGGDDRT